MRHCDAAFRLAAAYRSGDASIWRGDESEAQHLMREICGTGLVWGACVDDEITRLVATPTDATLRKGLDDRCATGPESCHQLYVTMQSRQDLMQDLGLWRLALDMELAACRGAPSYCVAFVDAVTPYRRKRGSSDKGLDAGLRLAFAKVLDLGLLEFLRLERPLEDGCSAGLSVDCSSLACHKKLATELIACADRVAMAVDAEARNTAGADESRVRELTAALTQKECPIARATCTL